MLGIAIAGGLVGGILLDLLTWWVARYGASGDSWSLRGNGALIVSFGLGPAVLVGGWTALVLHSRSNTHWRALGSAAGLVGVLIVVISVALLMVFGSAGQQASNSLTMVILAWTVIAPVLAGLLRGPTTGWKRPLLHLAAGVLFTVSLAAGFLGAELIVSPGS